MASAKQSICPCCSCTDIFTVHTCAYHTYEIELLLRCRTSCSRRGEMQYVCHRGGLLTRRGHRRIALEQGAEVTEVRLRPVPLTGNPRQLVGQVDLSLSHPHKIQISTRPTYYILTYRCPFALYDSCAVPVVLTAVLNTNSRALVLLHLLATAEERKCLIC